MIKVIRDPLWRLFYYWEKLVMDRLGRHRLNGHCTVVIRPQYWFLFSPNSHEYRFRGERSRSIPGLHTPAVIQIPIVPRHFVPPCLRPAVSSLGACPTSAR